MKQHYPHRGLVRLCGLFGVTRQAYYQQQWRAVELSLEHSLVLEEVLRIRALQPMPGTRKLQVLLEPFLLCHSIKLGRDGLFDLLQAHGLLVRRRRRRVATTDSFHRYHKWEDLTKGLRVSRPGQLWVSDITYYQTGEGFLYMAFITDACSHKIVGYQLGDRLVAGLALSALQMALDSHQGKREGLIHHSDRGVQYCCDQYSSTLLKAGVRISMTQNGDPRENAVAERLNGIIKNELLVKKKIRNTEEGRSILKDAVDIYNQMRPHLSCGMLTPEVAHKREGPLEKKWKNYYKSARM